MGIIADRAVELERLSEKLTYLLEKVIALGNVVEIEWPICGYSPEGIIIRELCELSLHSDIAEAYDVLKGPERRDTETVEED